jgi:hypothetical protein
MSREAPLNYQVQVFGKGRKTPYGRTIKNRHGPQEKRGAGMCERKAKSRSLIDR